MNLFIRLLFIGCWLLLGMLLLAGFNLSFPEKPDNGFWVMKGTRLVHEFHDQIDSISGQEIFELQDEKGLTTWFGREIFKDVCITGLCKMIRVWLFWDGAGNYLGLQLPENEPLTKSDHDEFTAEDYKKLDDILKDSASILKDMDPRDLTVEDPSVIRQDYEIDGTTGATPVGLVDVVVKDAVYTCYTLWHTVYGHTQAKIWDILDRRVNQNYLSLLFDSGNPSFRSLAIRSIEQHPEYHEEFFPTIIALIKSDHDQLSAQALDYFNSTTMQNKNTQISLVETLSKVGPIKQNQILWKFSEVEADVEIVPKLLQLYIDQKIGLGTLNLIYKMVRPEHIEQSNVMVLLDQLKTHENGYVRNLTAKLLDVHTKK
jgi:hypothetical protein